jgi:hypothetical protein
MELDYTRLRELLNYAPSTGIFTWNVSRGRATAGAQAGSEDYSGYVLIRVDKILYKAHRLAVLYMTGKWPECQVDHINGVEGDNRWSNLRECTVKENHNFPLAKTNNSIGQLSSEKARLASMARGCRTSII